MAIGRLGGVISDDSSRIMARSMALRSSRTLPGQSCVSSSLAAIRIR
jgi:hypothetical protein